MGPNYHSSLLILLFCSITLFSHSVSGTAAEAMVYDRNCLGCIIRGYRYCEDFQTCLDIDGTCPRGYNFTIATGCPVSGECDFGFKGIAYLGDDTMPAGGNFPS